MESCGSSSDPRVEDPIKKRVFRKIMMGLLDLNEVPDSAESKHKLQRHFATLPATYALHVENRSSGEMLNHRRLLHLAKFPPTRPAIDVQSINLTRPMHEITLAMNDKPNLLDQLTSLLAERGLNIQEAHAFSTSDGYSLDVFVVYGWERDTEDLREAVMRDLLKLERDGTAVWEIDVAQLEIRGIVASWLHGKVHQGTYCGQDVAIKIVDEEKFYDDYVEQEFRQEIYIMRQVRHKNVIQFIGACTKIPTLYIVTEFMSGGSVHDFLHRQGGVFELPSLLKTAIGISKAMNHMHQKRIIHRDLRTENLLMDEDQVVKVAEFGVARVQARSGAMTPETGTYRWMAPEVIQRESYNHKADVFSFGILLWELLTGELPYGNLTAGQVVRGVVQEGLRPAIPEDTNEMLSGLIQSCWSQDPALRPDFSRIIYILRQIGI